MSYLGRSAKLSRKTQEKVSFLATAGQTNKAGLSYVPTFVEVTVNGILLTDVTDYTATSGSSITFTVALGLNDEVTVVSLKTFALANHYNRAEADAAFEPIDSAYTKAEGDARYEPIDSAYTKAEADANLAAMVDSAPAALNTLNELAAALGDDVNFSTTVNNSIATKLPKSGGTMTGDTLHGDSVKAKFGAGNDLEIYHDGSNSVITDVGVGNLEIRAANIRIKNPSQTKSYLNGDDGGAITIFHDGAQKIATTSTGIDVTGTVTADGLVVDGNIEVNGNAISLDLMEADQTDKNTRIRANGGTLGIQTLVDDKSSNKQRVLISHTTGDISFYEDTGSTAKFFWDASAERLGLGTISPTEALDVKGNIKSDSWTNPKLKLRRTGNAAGNGSIESLGSDDSVDYKITFAGNTAGTMQFSTATEDALTIDSSGKVLVGKTAPTISTAGVELRPNGQLFATQSASYPLLLNRLTSDGDIAQFRKDNTTVGSIGSRSATSSYLELAPNYAGLTGSSTGGGALLPFRSGAIVNAAIDLGYSGGKFKDAYLSGGVYLGGTGAANKLDDYEEGTWTPVISDATTGGNLGTTSGVSGYDRSYTKIGSLVNVRCRIINMNTTGMGLGNIYIQGLPFQANGEARGVVITSNFTPASNSISLAPTVLNNTSYISLHEGITGSTRIIANSSQFASGSADLYINLTYQTD